MDKKPIEDVIPNLDSSIKSLHREAVETIETLLVSNDDVILLLLQQFYNKLSENICNVVVSAVNESRSTIIYNFIRDMLKGQPTRILPTLKLLIRLLSRTESEPTWIFNITDHEVFGILLDNLENSNLKSILPPGLVFISMLIPLAPIRLTAYFDKLANILSRTLIAYNDVTSSKLHYIKRLCFHYFVTLYCIYPYRVLSWCSGLQKKSIVSGFIESILHLIPLHPKLLESRVSLGLLVSSFAVCRYLLTHGFTRSRRGALILPSTHPHIRGVGGGRGYFEQKHKYLHGIHYPW